MLGTISLSKAQEFNKMSLALKLEQKKVILKMEYENLTRVESWDKMKCMYKSVMGNVSNHPEISLPNEKMKRLISRELNGTIKRRRQKRES